MFISKSIHSNVIDFRKIECVSANWAWDSKEIKGAIYLIYYRKGNDTERVITLDYAQKIDLINDYDNLIKIIDK